jgi:hypothetical protein
MTTLPQPVAISTNRWAMIAVLVSVLALGQIVVAGLVAFGVPYCWADGPRSAVLWGIAHNVVSAIFMAFALIGLVLGTTAVVQCRAAKGAERGLGAAYAAVVLSLSTFAVAHLVWLVGSLINLILMGAH